MVAFNVCAIADTMFEDSLFGHVRGAFTGATSDSVGFLKEAQGGTAFLDEVSGLSSALQPKLLRVIETGVFRPVGSSRDVQSDFRVVSATNQRLSELVESAAFRADLAHRLSGVVIQIPALRDRAEDIPALVRHFLSRWAPEAPTIIDPAVLSMMMERHWPGNIRELRQVVESSAVFGSNVIDRDSFALAVASRSQDVNVSSPISPRGRLMGELERLSWDTRAVAARLGVHRATVYRWMRRYKIEPPTSPVGDVALPSSGSGSDLIAFRA
jgi:DNA-binding NtrC family response regulator